jgi:hypothetical protein
MNQSRHLYSANGHWVAFLVGDDVFWRDGERMGWFEAFERATAADQAGESRGPDHGLEHGPLWTSGVVRTRDGEQIGVVTERSVIVLHDRSPANA